MTKRWIFYDSRAQDEAQLDRAIILNIATTARQAEREWPDYADQDAVVYVHDDEAQTDTKVDTSRWAT